MSHSIELTIQCPHCRGYGCYDRADAACAWLICPACDRHFARPAAQRAWPLRAAGIVAALVALGAITATPGAAQEAPRPLVVTAENLRSGNARHQEAASGDEAALLPGDVVHYRLRFTNVTAGAVQDVVFTNPIPSGLRYVDSSAAADREDVTIEYSIDGGATYHAQPMIVEIVDGERVARPAPPEMYTHLRWTVRSRVAPGAQVTAEFRAELRAPAEPHESATPSVPPNGADRRMSEGDV